MKKILFLLFVCAGAHVYAQDTLYLAKRVTLVSVRTVPGGYTKVRVLETVSTTAPNTFWAKDHDLVVLRQKVRDSAMHVVIRAHKLLKYYPAPKE